MTQYDAGPGDWSDREWEMPDRKTKGHVKRPKIVLPPWALLAIVIGLAILLCVALIYGVKAIRGGDGTATPTPTRPSALDVQPTASATLLLPTVESPRPTATELPPTTTPTETPGPVEIGPGVKVVVQGTGRAGLSLRAEPSTQAQRVAVASEGTVLTVVEGPESAGGYVWWKVRTAEGTEGWGAADWLEIAAEQ